MGVERCNSPAFALTAILSLAIAIGINGGAIMDHEAPCERRFVAVEK